MTEARSVLVAVRAAPGHTFLADDTSLAHPEIDLVRVATSSQITDAHLANLAAALDAMLATMDAGIPNMLAQVDTRHVLLIPREG